MDIVFAIVLGAVQGVTEFLPVSSSGHLALLQKIFDFSTPALFFDIMLHLGTLLSVLIVLRTEILEILRKPVQKKTLLLILSTLITAVFAILLKKIPGKNGVPLLESAFSSTKFLGAAFLLTSLILFISERLYKRHIPAASPTPRLPTPDFRLPTPDSRPTTHSDPAPKDAIVIGLCQGLGVLPGVSRSGSTIAGALACGMERGSAASYSFLLAIPAILGALVLEVNDGAAVSKADILPVLAGTLTAAIVGFFAVRFMLKIIRTRTLYGFSVYTALLGLAVLFFCK